MMELNSASIEEVNLTHLRLAFSWLLTFTRDCLNTLSCSQRREAFCVIGGCLTDTADPTVPSARPQLPSWLGKWLRHCMHGENQFPWGPGLGGLASQSQAVLFTPWNEAKLCQLYGTVVPIERSLLAGSPCLELACWPASPLNPAFGGSPLLWPNIWSFSLYFKGQFWKLHGEKMGLVFLGEREEWGPVSVSRSGKNIGFCIGQTWVQLPTQVIRHPGDLNPQFPHC